MTTEESTKVSARSSANSYLKALWWLVVIRGLLLIVLGVLALITPLQTVAALVLLLGAYALIDGVLLCIAAFVNRKTLRGWGWEFAHGILSILAGALILLLPEVSGFVGLIGTLTVLWFLVGSRAVGGILELIAVGRDTDRALPHRGWRIAGGIISILFAVVLGLIVILNPVGSAVALIWMFGIFAIIVGITMIVDRFVLRSSLRKAFNKK